jgi:hypothetical protein
MGEQWDDDDGREIIYEVSAHLRQLVRKQQPQQPQQPTS